MSFMVSRPGLGLIALIAALFCGCHTPARHRSDERHAERTIRSNAYSLLYQLLSQQKNVGLLLVIKSEGDRINAVVREIARDSTRGARLIEEFAAEDETLLLDDTWLPPAESAAREVLADAMRRDLLRENGKSFEFHLLIAQSQALPYAAALAEVAAGHESRPSRANALRELGAGMRQHHQEVLTLLQSAGR
ncbi:MAG: hypothetical protein J0L84_19420 [Verrucomicrobia bacterium]|nr:hypothetical protein [Verrucomicrobiota bacterium]